MGKSSVINRLVHRKNLACVGATPGKTTHINYFLIDKQVYFVDLPGYGYAKVSKQERARWGKLIEQWFADTSLLTLGILLVDLRHKPTADDCVMAQWFQNSGKPFVVVANKQDKIKKSEWEQPGPDPGDPVPGRGHPHHLLFLPKKGLGKEELMAVILDHIKCPRQPDRRKTNRETRLAPEREENNMRRVGGLFLFAILAGFCIGLGGYGISVAGMPSPGAMWWGLCCLPSACSPSVPGAMRCLRARPATCLKTLAGVPAGPADHLGGQPPGHHAHRRD